MVKAIKTQSGIHNVNTEEMLLTFENMIYKFAHECVNKLKSIEGNLNEFDDYVQIARIEAISAFNRYNIENGINFSTYLTKTLKYTYVHLVRDMNAKKRKVDKPLVYINNTVESGDDGTNVIPSTKLEIEEIENNLEKFLLNNLTKDELLYLNIALQKKVGKAKGIDKSSLMFTLDFLNESIEIDIKTKADLADYMGMSRPTLNKRIDIALKKTQDLIREYLKVA